MQEDFFTRQQIAFLGRSLEVLFKSEKKLGNSRENVADQILNHYERITATEKKYGRNKTLQEYPNDRINKTKNTKKNVEISELDYIVYRYLIDQEEITHSNFISLSEKYIEDTACFLATFVEAIYPNSNFYDEINTTKILSQIIQPAQIFLYPDKLKTKNWWKNIRQHQHIITFDPQKFLVQKLKISDVSNDAIGVIFRDSQTKKAIIFNPFRTINFSEFFILADLEIIDDDIPFKELCAYHVTKNICDSKNLDEKNYFPYNDNMKLITVKKYYNEIKNSPNRPDNFLYWAIRAGDLATVEKHLDEIVDVNQKYDLPESNTLLHAAVIARDFAIIDMLLAIPDIDVDVMDSRGHIPWDVATIKGFSPELEKRYGYNFYNVTTPFWKRITNRVKYAFD